jgi:hypothetical protein
VTFLCGAYGIPCRLQTFVYLLPFSAVGLAAMASRELLLLLALVTG